MCVTFAESKCADICAPRCSATECNSGASGSSFLLIYITQPSRVELPALPFNGGTEDLFCETDFNLPHASSGVYRLRTAN